MKLTPEQNRAYWSNRLDGQRLPSGPQVMAKCPLHGDRSASLSLNLETGGWTCHGGCGNGWTVDFEMRIAGCDKVTAQANVAEVCGIPQGGLFCRKPTATYLYQDEDGVCLFEKQRFVPGKNGKPKDFVLKAANGAYSLEGVRKVLYRLPEVIRAADVIVCEGEKCCERVASLNFPCAVTTNFDGAEKWRSEYSPYFAGKRVVILADNDAIGKKHAQQVAASVSPYARTVKVVEFPELLEKGDVYDYLELHTAQELLARIKSTPYWKPETKTSSLLIDAVEFLSASSPEIDWLVEGLIQRRANGFICADPKVGKSWVAVELALSLAMGLPWIGFNVRGPVKVALITREDNAALTRWRMDRLVAGRNISHDDLRDRLYVNTREQSPNYKIDTDVLFLPMVAELKAVKPELVILDVFNRLHSADENDNSEMRAVLDHVDHLQSEVGCAVGIVHHFNKSGEGSLTQRLRGAGAIAGFAEWLIGLERIDEHVRKMQFDIKVAESPEPIYFRIAGEKWENCKRLERTDTPTIRRGKVSDLLAIQGGSS